MTQITKDTRLLLSDGKIVRVLRVDFDDKYKTDVVTLAGTLTYKDAQARSRVKLTQILEKIEAGTIKIVTTKEGKSLTELGTGDSNWRPEIVDTILS